MSTEAVETAEAATTTSTAAAARAGSPAGAGLRLAIGPLRLRVERRTLALGVVLLALLMLMSTASLMSGTTVLGAGEVLGALLSGPVTEPAASGPTASIVWMIRLPRVVVALCVGAALGAAGAAFQSVSRNALGSPDVIGFTTGAATGAVVQIVVLDIGAGATALAAVLAGLVTATAVYLLARSHGVSGGYRLVLIGIGVSSFLSAANALVLARGDLDLATRARIWLSGSLNARTWDDAWPVLLAIVALLPVLGALSRRMDVLEMGDDQADQLGASSERTRLATMMTAVVLTAASVAAAGPIAFVALAAPQVTRRLTRAARVQVLCSALMGAAMLISADLLSVHLPVPVAMPVGLTTGVIGGVYLLWVLTRTEAV